MIILAGVILTIAIAARANLRQRKSDEKKKFGETETFDPRISMFMLLVIVAAFIYALVPALSWPRDVGRIPMVTVIPGIALCVLALAAACRKRGDGAVSLSSPVLARAGYFFFWLCGAGLATVIAGQLVALPLFMGLYILVWGKYKWWLGAIYAAVGLGFLYVMFDEIVAVIWYPSLIFG